MGEQGLKDELTEAGISSVGVGPDPFPDGAPDKLIPEVPQDSSIKAVIVGYDHFVSLPKLVKVSCSFRCFYFDTTPIPKIALPPQVCTYARYVEPEFFLASNSDARQPTPYNQVWPETGPFISFVSKSPQLATGAYMHVVSHFPVSGV